MEETLAANGREASPAADPGNLAAEEIFQDDFPPQHPKAEFLDMLQREMNRLHGLVDVVLDHSRGTSRINLSEAVDLSHLLATAARPCQFLATKKMVQLRTEFCVDSVIRGELGQLRQLVSNVLLNAIQAAPPNSKVCAKIESGKTLAAGSPRVVRLRMEDEGTGIPEHHLAKVFEPFFTTKQEGTGIGLDLSCRLARAHRGELVATNRAGGGARFTLTLPHVGNDGDSSGASKPAAFGSRKVGRGRSAPGCGVSSRPWNTSPPENDNSHSEEPLATVP